MKIRILMSIFFIIANTAIWSQTKTEDPILSKIAIEVPTEKQMLELATRYEVIEKEGQVLELIIPDVYIKDAEKIAGTKAKILEKDIHEKIRTAVLDEYPSYQQIQTQLKNWAQKHSSFVKYEQYGTSTSGHPLVALKISDNPQKDEDEPAVLLTAATHGDELITTKVMLAVIEKIINGYGASQQINKIVEQKEIWFIPVISPDGYTKRSRYVGWTDPNRDFPWPQKQQHDSIPCIHHLRNFFAKQKFNASIDYHAFGRMFMYPWAYTKENPAKSIEFHQLAQGMAKFNNYRYGQISKIIYIAKGSSADYFYWKHKTVALAVEVGSSKIPHGPEIDRVIQENINSALHFIEFSATAK